MASADGKFGSGDARTVVPGYAVEYQQVGPSDSTEITSLQAELRAARAESARHLAVAEAAAGFIDDNRQLRGGADDDELFAKVEAWRVENERRLNEEHAAPVAASPISVPRQFTRPTTKEPQ